ncbi:MAG: beta-ketoacyl-ACP synthase II [Planctomycetia bacterium]|nr:beta-ketoacyl-ACP synthase II [Planctomycetia bacterium]
MRKRIVVTGMGVVSPVGIGVANFWQSLKEGRCGVGPITQFDASRVPCKVAAECSDFRPADWLEHRVTQRTARFTQLALVAAREAWQQANLPERAQVPERVTVWIGNGIGGLEIDSESQRKLVEKGPSRMSAMTIPKMIPNEAAANIAMEFGIKGAVHTVVTACASGTDAIGHALDYLRLGKADMAVAGGTEATITEFGVGAFCALKALATAHNDNPEKASRPFDKDRDGFVMGEGAAILVMESLEHAVARNAPILGEICGYGATSDAWHLTAPDPEGIGAANAVRLALEDAGISPRAVDYVNAHGTATPTNDPIETAAIKQALGPWAYETKVSSIKGMIGHCLGAAGALEAVACIQAIREHFCPPTINLDEPDPKCDLNYIPNKGVPACIENAISLSLGFGGHNGVLVFGSCNR